MCLQSAYLQLLHLLAPHGSLHPQHSQVLHACLSQRQRLRSMDMVELRFTTGWLLNSCYLAAPTKHFEQNGVWRGTTTNGSRKGCGVDASSNHAFLAPIIAM